MAGGLRLRLDPALPEIELEIAGVGVPLRLAPRLELVGAPPEAAPGAGRSLASGELRALAGPAWRAEVQSIGAARAGLRWTLELPRSGDGVVFSLFPLQPGFGRRVQAGAGHHLTSPCCMT